MPNEILDIIYKKLHNLYMLDICNEISYCIVWIRLKTGEYSFLVGNYKKNYYNSLSIDFKKI